MTDQRKTLRDVLASASKDAEKWPEWKRSAETRAQLESLKQQPQSTQPVAKKDEAPKKERLGLRHGEKERVMRFQVTMKDPDVLSDAIADAVELSLADLCLPTDEVEALRQARCSKASELANQWFECGEYLTVEIDTETKTIRVLSANGACHHLASGPTSDPEIFEQDPCKTCGQYFVDED